jgi:putative SOS response-associated peptidase YedK
VCNLYNIKTTRAEFLDYFQAQDDFRREVDKDYVSPGRSGYVVREVQGIRQLDVMTWGFPFQGKPVTNVRNYGSPFWRSALTMPEQRCLVAVTEFQEWSAAPDAATGKKKPYWFSLPSRPIFAFAGIWRPAGDDGAFYSFLTTGYDGDPSAHVVGAVHPKAIPVILHEEYYDQWLHAPVDQALELAAPFPSQLMAVRS